MNYNFFFFFFERRNTRFFFSIIIAKEQFIHLSFRAKFRENVSVKKLF